LLGLARNPLFTISEFSPMKRQPAASNDQRSSVKTSMKAARSISLAGCDGGFPTAVGLSPMS